MNRITHIYILIDPRDSEVRYVGKTCQEPRQRLRSHINESNWDGCQNTHKNNWLRGLVKEGYEPVMLVIDTVDEDKGESWEEKERYWIKYFKDRGRNLTNRQEGGYGVHRTNRYRPLPKWSNELREKMNAFKAKPFPDEYLDKLGVIEDCLLAKMANIHHVTVTRKRKELSIPPVAKPRRFEWNEEAIALLGTMPDRELAKKFGLTFKNIQRARSTFGIEIPEEFLKVNLRKKRDKCDQYLKTGDLSDTEIGEMLGMDKGTVGRRRKELGLPRLNKKRKLKSFDLPKEIQEQLGKIPDADLAKIANCSKRKIQRARHKLGIYLNDAPFRKGHFEWTDNRIALLGTDYDTQVAKQLNITPTMVKQTREKLGIPPCRGLKRKRSKLIDWNEEKISMLSTNKDSYLAKLWDVSVSAVTKKRNQLGIPPFKR